jgi:preprotein translocase subunit SecA
MMKIFNALPQEEGMAIEHKMLSSTIEKAQKKIESNNFSIRRNLLQYDEVINEQRELIYAERRRVLHGEDMHGEILRMISEVMDREISSVIEEGTSPDSWDLELLNRTILPIAPIRPLSMNPEDYQGWTREKLVEDVVEKTKELYEAKKVEITESFGSEEVFPEVERVYLLRTIDQKWMSHIDDMDQLRQGITLQAFAQKDPVVEYRYAGIDMFEEMTASIAHDIVTIMLHIRRKPEAEREQVAKVTGTNKDETVTRQPVRRKAKKIGPNDPCPCGKCYPDGRPIKYKNCCGRNRK